MNLDFGSTAADAVAEFDADLERMLAAKYPDNPLRFRIVSGR
jgi:hypothetical protein